MADFRQIFRGRRRLTTTGLFVLLVAVLFLSRFHMFLMIWSFIGGVVLCSSFVNSETLLPNLLRWHVRKKKSSRKPQPSVSNQDDELSLLKKVCPVCGKENCSRHRPELNIVALQPWTNLKVPEKVDAALEEFMNLVLKEFIYTWYRELSQDEAFIDELKSSLRFITSVLLRRLKKVDLPQLILDSALKTTIRHLHFYVQVKNRAKKDEDLQDAMLQYYGAHLHCAARNRQAELDYLRTTAERVFPYILPLQSLKCKGLCVLLREILAGAILLPAMDKIADPDLINNLLLIFLDNSPPPVCNNPSLCEVPILANFAHPLSKNQSCLHLELADILGNPEALFPFMQFMKTEASVNVLQFYLSAEEFNSKMLTPELTEDQLSELHQELRDLYRMYCGPNAVDRIQFDDDIVRQLQDICDGAPEDVVRLQTTTPLFRAYEHAYTLLDTTFLPLFHQSDDYYMMLCGERLPTKLTRSLSRANKRAAEPLTLSRIGSKIKGVFKTNTVEGRLLDEGVDCAVEEAEPIMHRTDSFDDYIPDTISFVADGGPLHDLSAWRVTVLQVAPRPEPDNPKKINHTFVIEIRRVDVLENDFEASNWRVERRYPEFYVLEQKLSEFHGEFDDAVLPAKKAFGTKNKEFLESKVPEFEQYLQKLLTKPKLRGSELLYNFLTSPCEFSTGFLTDISLGKFVKSGAMKLVKERGQHLEPFLQSLLASTESSKPKPRVDVDADTISISSEQMANALFENNADMEFDISPATPVVLCPGFEYPVDGTCDTLLYLAEHVYRAPRWFLHMMLSLRILIRNSLDTFSDWYLGTTLERVTQEHRIERVINLLRDVLFFDTDPPRTDEQKRRRRDEALHQLKEFIPKLFVQAIGSEKQEAGTELIFELFQYPKLNKQLSYMLFDHVIDELFPEVLTSADDDPLKGLVRAARADE